jgi:antirestriction protein
MISNHDDVIDSRDVIARIDELEDKLQDNLLDDDELAEIDALKELAAEASGYAADWEYGETLIHDSYFEDYTREFAEDCGFVNADASWPNNHIDWEAAARELQYDYTSVEFDGVTYWIR